MCSNTLSFLMRLLYTLNSVVGTVDVAYDLNLSGHRAFIFLEARFLAFLCAVTHQRRENVLFYNPLFCIHVCVPFTMSCLTGSLSICAWATETLIWNIKHTFLGCVSLMWMKSQVSMLMLGFLIVQLSTSHSHLITLLTLCIWLEHTVTATS